ncbi:saccharopine dehydrogenase NADP-binding domain-containing protein [Gordonia malaquae]|uniref:saccharopine dehydrogenase NADP-binding domain-containing protein n=1 Tax=Gordonia malaquae TaxID=410332 RepID=UPI0030FF2E9A
MRVAVLGAGAMGARAAATLAAHPAVDSLVIADINRDALEQSAGTTMSARTVDVTDGAALRALLFDVNVVISTVGPFYRFGTAVLEASIDTSTDYVDICDDWEPTGALLDLDAAAREANVCAVVGAGASPGLSTLLASAAAARLDSVHNVFTAWPLDAPATPIESTVTTSAAAVHWMHQCSGTVAEVSDGVLVRRRPVRAVALTLPGGRSGTGYTVGHPEPLTLHRTMRPSGEAACLMLLRPTTAAYVDALRSDIDAGFLTAEAAADLLDSPSIRHSLRSLPRSLRFAGPGTLPEFFAAADGLVDGVPTRVSARLVADQALFSDMAGLTGVPAALAAIQLVDGHRLVGVHPPDAALDQTRMLADFGVAFPGTHVTVEEEPGWLTT